MIHRHRHKRRHKKKLKYYLSIVIFLLLCIAIILYYIDNKRQPAWKNEYVLDYSSTLDKDTKNGLARVFPIGQRIPIESILKDAAGIRSYELIVGNKIRGPMDGFCLPWESLYIQSTMRFQDDFSWDDFEDENIIESDSNTNGMLASNFNMEQPIEFSKQPTQDQAEENAESDVANPSEEDLEAIIEQWAYNLVGDSSHDFTGGLPVSISYGPTKSDDYENGGKQTPPTHKAISDQWAYNVGGGSSPGFTGGLQGSIGYGPTKSDDYANGGKQTPPTHNDNDPVVPVPEPSTLLLTGLGLILLFRRIRKSVVDS